MIRYEVSLAHPEQHLFHITMIIPDVEGEVVVQIPAWNALYQIRDFSAHIQRVEAFELGAASDSEPRQENPAAIEKIDKQSWRIHAHGTVKVRYATYWDEPGPFATQLNQEHAFVNPAMILMYVPERRGEAVALILPDVPEPWNAAGPENHQIWRWDASECFPRIFKTTTPWRMHRSRLGNLKNFSWRA